MTREARTLRSMRRRGWKFSFSFMHDCRGLCNFVSKEITINPFLTIASVIIHEVQHKVRPRDYEKDVLRYETRRREHLSQRQAEEIVKVYSLKLYRSLKQL